MAHEGAEAQPPRQRTPELLESGVPNLDRVLGGGIARGSTVMLLGSPGVGKTTLALQVAFHGAARGARCLYLSGYSETHDKLVSHAGDFSFFDPAALGEQIQLISLTDLLRTGAEEAEEAIVGMVRTRQVALVVLDGFAGMRRFLSDELAIAHFLYSLGAKLALLGATTLVTSVGSTEEIGHAPELTVCDVILGLRRERDGSRHRRVLDAIKVRGAASLDGVHSFTIDTDGMAVYPRLESIVPSTTPAPSSGRAGFGIAEIDALLGGGLPIGSAVVAAGSPGAGRTLLGLQFAVEGARVQETALVLSFKETTAQLRGTARAFGMGLAAAEADGRVVLQAMPGYDVDADRVVDLLRGEIARLGVRRLVIDSAAELERGIVDADRRPEFFAALVSYLRGLPVTTYLTLDVPRGTAQELDLTDTPLTVLAENLLLVREVEYFGHARRVISVLRMRYSGYDPSIREFQLTVGQGIQMLGVAPPSAGSPTGAPISAANSTSESEPDATAREH